MASLKIPRTANALAKALSQGIALLLGLLLQGSALAIERSDILLDIVTHCMDPGLANYCSLCRAPRNDGGCGAALDCRKSTEIWALNDRYTAIRDIKMCGCPSGFVHGLALPRYPVSGVEDPGRPDGIWQFAWNVASSRMARESIALVVNPRRLRSQNQLHVHLLRLTPDARRQLGNESPAYISRLDQVWARAAQSAAAKGLDDYGVIVIQRPQLDYMVVVTSVSPEAAFTQWRCD